MLELVVELVLLFILEHLVLGEGTLGVSVEILVLFLGQMATTPVDYWSECRLALLLLHRFLTLLLGIQDLVLLGDGQFLE